MSEFVNTPREPLQPAMEAVRLAEEAARQEYPDSASGKRDPSIGLRRSGFRVGYLAALAAPIAPAAGSEPVALHGWKIDTARPAEDSDGDIVAGIWELGHRDEDGNFYAIASVDTGIYDQPEAAEPLAHAMLARLATPTPAVPTKVAEIEWLTAELHEQARLNGMGSEREAALLAKVDALTRERDKMCHEVQAVSHRWSWDAESTGARIIDLEKELSAFKAKQVADVDEVMRLADAMSMANRMYNQCRGTLGEALDAREALRAALSAPTPQQEQPR